jgi:isoleucyl-tRNA synthetase
MELKSTLLMPKTTFEMKANLPVKEPTFIAYWQTHQLYEKMREKNKGKPEFQLHDGPPYANGDIHVGHMLNRILKDVVVRYQHMLGKDTPFVFGWDTHGLPIENYITKNGVNRKTMSVADFRQLCDTFAKEQVEKQKIQIRRLGMVGDYDHPYLTLQPSYEAAQIGVFATMALKGLIYKGLKPVHWSPSSESALAEAEIVYEDVTDQAIHVGFTVVDGKGVLPIQARIVIWTTTPWTIPANLAIAAHGQFDYGLYQTSQGLLVFANDLAKEVENKLALTSCQLIKTIKGKELEGVQTKHPFYDRKSPVILGDHVTIDTGTGFVHTAPGHGEEDFIVGTKYRLPPLCPVDSRGYMTQEAGESLQGLFYADANKKVIEMLKEVGSLLAQHAYLHPYPHDWRTGKPLIYRATPQWFASINPIREQLLSEIQRVKWTPSWGQVRIHNMIKDRGDWCISRQRVWGVPIPIIYQEDGLPIIDKQVFDHIQQLIGKHGSSYWFTATAQELLPPGYTHPSSPKAEFRKETDIMDVWFDSGSSSISVLKQRGLKFPSDVYLEGSDQYRGWFNSSLIISVATEGIAPYQHIVSHGFVVDGKGEKMSKSKGNGIDPLKMMQVYGADIMRLWATSIDYTSDARASEDIFKGNAEAYRKIRNTFKFILGNLADGDTMFDPKKYPVESLSWIDDLILARLHHVTRQVKEAMDAYNFSEATANLLSYMTQDLSSFYLDITKDILYCEAKTSSRRVQVQHVLYEVALTLMKLWTPMMPFTMEEVFQQFPQRSVISSQLLDYPLVKQDETSSLAIYQQLMQLKEIANRSLETLRASNQIGSAQEASLALTAPMNLAHLLTSLPNRERNRLFIVSETTVKEGSALSADAKPFLGQKCPRCWNYFLHLHAFEEHHICDRCLEVLNS